jgi:hypothetical protein
MTEKHTSNASGSFTMRRSDERREFVCDRCLKPKTSKIQVAWDDRRAGETKTICTGCYGELLAKQL